MIAASRRRGIEAESSAPTSTRTGVRRRLRDGLDRRDERERRHDHLVTRLDAGGEQREAEGIEAARDADAVTSSAEGRKRRLELLHLRPVR